MLGFERILYLDDMRVPTLAGVDHVRSYAEFVLYLQTRGMPDLISFDHDLSREHYPVGENKAGEVIPYESYAEETGLECARYIVRSRLDLKHWMVHSANVQGRINIERELRAYRRRGEVRGTEIPFVIPEAVEVAPRRAREVVATKEATGFSRTSLLQFDGEFALESWEKGLPLERRKKGTP